MNHEYCCEHEVKYCKVCNVCYCKKCGKEWKVQTYYYYPYQWPYTYGITYPADATITTSHEH